MKKERKHENMRKVFLSFMCLVAVLACVTVFRPLRAQAVEGDARDRTISLSVELSYDGEAVEGVEVCLFYVGSVSGDAIVLEGNFARYAVTTGGSGETDWNSLALTLAGYSYLDALEPDEKDDTDANGEAFFPVSGETLQEGVYLVLTQAFQQNGVTYSTQPFLVVLPDEEGDSVTYQVVAEPKVTGQIGVQKLTVLKIWDDSDNASRPDSVEVTLVSDDGEVWDTVTLSEENSWRYTFSGLPEGTSWYIVEDVPDGYTVLQTADGTTIALTNSMEEEEPETTTQEEETTTEAEEGTTTVTGEETTIQEDTTAASDDETTDSQGETTTTAASSEGEETTTELTKLPQTGTLWWLVPILACCGMVSVLIGVAKKRGQEEE